MVEHITPTASGGGPPDPCTFDPSVFCIYVDKDNGQIYVSNGSEWILNSTTIFGDGVPDPHSLPLLVYNCPVVLSI